MEDIYVFKMHGVGIVRLERKLATLITDKEQKEDYEDDNSQVMEAIHDMYAQADEKAKRLVKLEVGEVLLDEAIEKPVCKTPGHVLYVPNVAIDVLEMSSDEAAAAVRDMLKFLIENAKSDDKETSEILASMRNNIRLLSFIEITKIDAAGVF